MPSVSLNRWNTTGKARLDEVAQAHQAVGGSKPGRRAATLQINHAYAMLLSSHFQGYCRDLHSEATDHLCDHLADSWARPILRARLAEGRKLDSGNPNPGNLGADFGRLGMALWPAMRAHHARTVGRQAHLEKLNKWRNAIAHQDFSKVADLDLGGGRVVLRLSDVRGWRAACEGLALTLDDVVGDHIRALVGAPPW